VSAVVAVRPAAGTRVEWNPLVGSTMTDLDLL
jgi:hypothetical protein